jgi:hypothetical protein
LALKSLEKEKLKEEKSLVKSVPGVVVMFQDHRRHLESSSFSL